VETGYDDGSFTQTVYSVGDQPVSTLPAPMGWMVAEGGAAAITLSPPAGLTIPAGGSETVTVAQRKLGDTPVVTYDVYDKAGNLVDVYEPAVLDGDPASATYGQMVSPHTHYAYDASGNEILQVSATEESAYATWLAGSRATPFTGGTTWTYDENGNELSRRLPDGEQETYTYDQYGNQITHVDFDGNTATSTYYTTGTQAGLLHQVVYTPGAGAAAGTTPQTVTYTYDDLGRQQSVAIATGPAGSQTTATTTDSYDAQGNLEEEQTPEGTIWYVFDPKTGLQTETYTDYTQTFYGYDDQGRLTSVSVQTRGTPTGTWSAPMVTTYTYDADGNKHTELLPNGILTTYGYRHLPGGRFIAALARSPGQRREAQ
jgi:YD repeat-containing protein